MAATLILVRHGETIWHADNRYAGVSDIPLTDRGREQAARLGRWAASEHPPPTAVWSSPLSRARATAAPAAAALGLTITVDADLTELNFGTAEGRTLAELPPAEAAAFRTDPVANAFPEAEDPRKAATRGAAALHRAAIRHPGERILVVAHNTLLRLTLCDLLGLPLTDYRRIFPRLENAARTEIHLTSTHTALLTLNTPLP